MTNQPSPGATPTPSVANSTSLLGLPMDTLAGLSIEELQGNKTAITMVMHYYKHLVDQNAVLQNQSNTYKTYLDAYKAKKLSTTIAGILFLVSNIGVGFGVNLLTNGTTWPGVCTLIPGVGFAGAAIYFTFRGE